MNGRDMMAGGPTRWVIDLHGLALDEVKTRYPQLYQHLLHHVKPTRDHVARKNHREKWWIWGESRPGLRRAISKLDRVLVTNFAAKHRVFGFFDPVVAVDHNMYVIATDDAFHCGVLSSRVQIQWMLAAGSKLEDRPLWVNSTCFLPFPFPDCTREQADLIRSLAERLDAHRKQRQRLHPALTITAMYNVLDRLRQLGLSPHAQPLTEKERAVHDNGLVTVLGELHDDLDAAVLDAYGWPAGLTDEELLERLVALNAERAAEEARGLVRWLRPDFQAPKAAPTQVTMPGVAPSQPPPALPAAAKPAKWPTAYTDKVALIRDLVFAAPRGATFSVVEIAARFKRAKPADIEKILDAIAGQGFLVAFEAEDGRRWARPARAA